MPIESETKIARVVNSIAWLKEDELVAAAKWLVETDPKSADLLQQALGIAFFEDDESGNNDDI